MHKHLSAPRYSRLHISSSLSHGIFTEGEDVKPSITTIVSIVITMNSCCFQGFRWESEPMGREAKVADRDTYIAGPEQDAAIILIHDVFGWTFGNSRLLAYHFASEVGATVYLPDL